MNGKDLDEEMEFSVIRILYIWRSHRWA